MVRLVLKLAIYGLVLAGVAFLWTTRSGPSVIQTITATAVPIADLAANPQKYDGRLIEIVGTPVPNARFSALGLGGIIIANESGDRIAVLVKKGIPPLEANGKLHFIGTAKNLVEIGALAVPVVIAE
ncbi:MAG: hypothetical protein QOF19_1932 [Alphaproteobacteria bacterium]|jgi:hypothetical protein|nr:hypothetical protein [Alphaproteobacteria bacterium]